MSGEVRVVPVTDAPWDAVRTVFGTRGDPAGCWCQYFKVTSAQWNAGDRHTFEQALCDQTRAGGAGPGLIAYLDDEPVGWVAVEPRTSYPRLLGGTVARASTEAPDAADVWAVTCFVVRVGFRRRGVSGALLRAAVDHARAHGARVIEGYPVDTAGRKVSSADLYHGPLSAFEAAGFTVSARPAPGRAVVRSESP